MKRGWTLKSGVLLALCVNVAYADDNTNDKITQLQKMLEEQQWQMKAMAEELRALQGAGGKAEGRPVFASFKDGVQLGDGSGNWQLAINGRGRPMPACSTRTKAPPTLLACAAHGWAPP